MRVLALVPNIPGHAPGQRTNIEAWAPYLAMKGVKVDFYPFETQNLHSVLYTTGSATAKARQLASAYRRYLADLPDPRDFDVVFVYREAALVGPALTERWLSWRRVPYVFAVDDPIFVPYRSPFQGSLSWLKFFRKAVRTCARSSATIVNSYPLKAWARQYCEDVTRIPSVVNVEAYGQVAKTKSERLVVGWSGSRTTKQNLVSIAPQLTRLQQEYDVVLRAIGVEGDGEDLEGIECMPWTADAEVREIKAFDVGLAPMIDNPWNHWKFSLKVAQYAAAGVPALASPIGDIPSQIIEGTTGYLARDPSDWLSLSKILLQDAELRARMSEAAQRHAEETYSAQATADIAFDVLTRVATRDQ